MRKKYPLSFLQVIVFSILILSVFSSHIAYSAGVNIIFFVTDGLSPGYWSVVREMSVGYAGETNLDRMPHTAHYSSYSADSWISESASTITAMMTGQKTNRGVLNEDASAIHHVEHGKQLETIVEYAAKHGYATGIITNDEIYKATPAGAYAHTHDRREYAIIASQLVESDYKPDIIFGGGRRYLKPADWIDPVNGKPGLREDGRDIVEEMRALGYSYLESAQDLEKWDYGLLPVLGVFDYRSLRYEIESQDSSFNDPHLWEMTEKSVRALHRTGKPFFLFIEAALIDHAAHDNDADAMLYECIAFDKALGVAQEYLARNPNTIILVAGDHATSGGSGIGFYAAPDTVEDNGFPGPYIDENSDGFPDNLDVDRPIVVGFSSSEHTYTPYQEIYARGHHTAEDCMLFAAGKGTHIINGFLDNTDIYQILKLALHTEIKKVGSFVNLIGNPEFERRPRKHRIEFRYEANDSGELRIELYNLTEKMIFAAEESISPGISGSITWKARRGMSPGFFRYRWYLNGQYRGKGTVGLN